VVLRPPPPPTPSVYILELDQGRVYGGSSKDVQRRLQQHVAGSGSAYTRVYRPTGVLLPRLGNVKGDGDAAERDETLRYMMMRGVAYVRGWKFSQVVMSPADFEEAEANIRELFNLCRRCGYQGHFITQCRASYDRWGQDVRSGPGAGRVE
jgi:predicted GIY-YIG superfamily endonuclease